jgi:capsular exopolysaccharide synthesis family protein
MEPEDSKNIRDREDRKHSTFNTESDPILFLHLFRKNLHWFGAIIFTCLAVAFTYLRYTVPIYESSLTFQVGTINTANQVLNVNNFQETNDLAKDIEILKSKLLFKRALSKINVDVTYHNKGKILTNELYKATPITVNYVISDSSIIGVPFYVKFIDRNTFQLSEDNKLIGEFKSGAKIQHPKVEMNIKVLINRITGDEFEEIKNTGLFFKINNIESLTNSYIGRLSVYPLNTSAKTINIAFKDNNSLKSTDIVTAVANEYINYDIEERSKSSKKVLGFIDNQLDKYYNKLKVSEKRIENFQKTNNYRGVELSSSYYERVNKIENELMDLDLKSSVLIEIKKSISRELKSDNVYNLLPILAGTEYEGDISSMISKLKELLVQKENMRYEVTGDSEALKSIDHKVEVQKTILYESISNLIEKFKFQKQELIIKIDEIDNKYLNIPAKELEYARLQRVLSIDEKFFTLLMDKRTEYSISEAGFVSQHKILDEALVPSAPVYPKKITFYFFAGVVGLVFSLVLLLIKYVLKNTISSIDEIIRQSFASVGVLGIVPKYKYDIPVSQLVVDKNPKSVIAESFRAIRSNLQFVSQSQGKKLIAITSTVSGEGKTFCAINIGGIIAYSGKKVILLDLDMRKPKIHLGFGVENTVGMSTLLIGKSTFEETIHHSDFNNLDFITSGPVPPNPSELIINGKLKVIIEDLKKTYDYVIVDNPPIGLVSDAMEMLKSADYPIYVFKNEYSKKNFVNNLDRLILDNGISKLSIILNSVEMGKGSYGSGYGYGYSYGYGYGGGYGYGYGHGYYNTDDVLPKKNKKFKKIFSRNK